MPTKANAAFSVRIRRTLEDLAGIRKALLADSEPSTDTAGTSSPTLDLELASELKSGVDVLRRLLWAYIQALSSKSSRPPDEVLNWHKMELAVEMLRSVRARAKTDPAASGEPSYTFDDLVSGAMAVTSLHTETKPAT